MALPPALLWLVKPTATSKFHLLCCCATDFSVSLHKFVSNLGPLHRAHPTNLWPSRRAFTGSGLYPKLHAAILIVSLSLSFSLSSSVAMAPLILHNVPDEECYVGEDGIKRPYAMIYP